MKNFIQLISVSVLLICTQVWAADKAPIGSWQLSTSTQLEVTTSTGKKVKSTPIKGYEFATFSSDGSYVSSEWVNKFNVSLAGSSSQPSVVDSFGQWYSKNNTSYSVAYDKYLLVLSDAKFGITNAAFFDRIGYIKFVKDNFNSAASLSVNVISYADEGVVNAAGKSLKGTKKIVIKASWKNGDVLTNADVLVKVTYTGKPLIQSTCCGTDTAKNVIDSENFMTTVGKLPDVKTTASGLKYIVLQDNPTGKTPSAATDTVTANYRGFFPSGQIFDRNSSTAFALDKVISGWTEGLQLMRKNAKYRFFIPSNLGYGETGTTGIPGNSALIFDVELLDSTPATTTTTP